MSSQRVGRRRDRVALLGFALGLCVTWLVVQNAALLLVTPWPDAPGPLVLARALVRAGWAVFQQLWPVAAVGTLGFLFVAWLVAGLARVANREVGHDGAR